MRHRSDAVDAVLCCVLASQMLGTVLLHCQTSWDCHISSILEQIVALL
jgi:hypothetical protein